MKLRGRMLVWSLAPLLVSMTSLLTVAGPASAAVNDGFSVSTSSGGCGSNEFVDYGPGAPGGGNNDDYVLIHELMHLREQNHGRRYWRHVERACPQFREAERWLRGHGRSLF